MAGGRRNLVWKYVTPLAAPLLLVAFALTLWEPVTTWLQGAERYDRQALTEWVQEARINLTLPELVGSYIDVAEEYRRASRATPGPGEDALFSLRKAVFDKHKELKLFLEALGEPVTKMYREQLPLFPLIYRIEVTFADGLGLAPVVWDSELPRHTDLPPSKRQYKELDEPIQIDPRGAFVQLQYSLRVFAAQQDYERLSAPRRLRVFGLATLGIAVALGWVYVAQARERERYDNQVKAEQKLHEAERLRLEQELLRREAERKREEAERVNLELKSQLWANIGIMAGSYAHNIKNLLVRPNDLLNRCLETGAADREQGHMLEEVRQTLGTVTERLQQILQTVRRDPTQSRKVRIDLGQMLQDMQRTWGELAQDRWKLTLTLDLSAEPIHLEGDRSHLQQAIENLLFNARDATFEMRNHLREQARQARPAAGEGAADPERRQALIKAAAWKGEVVLRTYRDGDGAVLEVKDNGIGMTEEVRRRCTETHFSTKRNNALFAGMSAGMGLGLSFILVILEHHHAELTIDSAPLQGATFRVKFPLEGAGEGG